MYAGKLNGKDIFTHTIHISQNLFRDQVLRLFRAKFLNYFVNCFCLDP